LALAIATPPLVEALKPPPPPPKELSDILAESAEKLVHRMKGQKAEPAPAPVPERPWTHYSTVIATALGLVGLLSGTVAWLRGEQRRFVLAALVLGTVAIVWAHIGTGGIGFAFLVTLILIMIVGLPLLEVFALLAHLFVRTEPIDKEKA
jgi:hypothetical protein